MCFDTSSNTGRFSGACVLIQRALGQSLLHFACRHHVLEIILQKVFLALNIKSASSGLDSTMFKCYKEQWSSIDQSSYLTAAEMTEIDSFGEWTLQFVMQNVEMSQSEMTTRSF